MSTYVIGDVHGCFDELKKLLKKISFNPSKDSIIFTGDLVNRGNQSLEVLEFCMKEKSIETVLGNHDVFLIKSLLGKKSPKRLKNICAHKNKKKFLEWLVKKPFLISKKLNGKEFIIVHAGIPPSWSIKDTKVFNATYSLFSKTTLAFNSLASSISLGPGASSTEYLFLNSCFNF